METTSLFLLLTTKDFLYYLQTNKIVICGLAHETTIYFVTIHWQAQVDGMDVEYLLGSSATWNSIQPKGYDDVSASPYTVEVVNFKRRAMQLRTLHFDKATRVTLEKDDVDTKLAHAYLGNDHHFPWWEIGSYGRILQ